MLLLRFAFIALTSLAFTACSIARVEIPEDILENTPPDYPVRTLTNFTDGLSCMDRMFKAKGVETLFITSANIPDSSEGHGAAGRGAKEMLISAISQMGQESGALRYVAYDRETPAILALQSVHPDKNQFKIPDFFIRGAITQIDRSPWNKQNGVGLTIGDVIKSLEGSGFSSSNSKSMSTIALDLNMGMVSSFQILPGISSANSMSVVKFGDSSEVSLSVEDVGAIFNSNENKAKALSTALRALIEVGAIELFGKLYDVPYWNCLAVQGTSTSEEAEAKSVYDSMDRTSMLKFVSEQLKHQKYLSEEEKEPILSNGEPSDKFRQAITYYKAIYGLSGNSLVNARMFEKLYIQAKAPANLTNASKEELRPVKRWLHATRRQNVSQPKPAKVTPVAKQTVKPAK